MRAITRAKLLTPALWIAVCGSASANAENAWNIATSVNAFYSDDVALFSVSRRLSLKDDPTQPIVDRPEQGGDFVYEPSAEIDWNSQNRFGSFNLSLDAGAYLFTQQTQFTHGLFEIMAAQSFASGTKVSLLYNVAPDLYLGRNLFRAVNGEEFEDDESLTNHYGSIHLDQALSESVTVRLLSRYGARVYNETFQHRDTTFWTLGPHLEWRIGQGAELLVGYHYERGSAAQHKAPHFPDDVSYVNHYASAELSLHPVEKLTVNLIFDYEKNDFTSANPLDEHYGAAEIVYQGEIELRYEVTERAGVTLGWQHGSRNLTTETRTVKNNNIWLGFEYSY